MSALTSPYLTVEEYLAHDRVSAIKSEYFRGQAFAMTGGSEPHALIAANAIGELRSGLKGRPCRVYSSDMRVKCPTGLFAYPDVSAVCGPPAFEDGRNDILLNPIVIVEVLSPSTESWDRGRKFEDYRRLRSLRDYLLVPQDRPCIQRFSRDADQQEWRLTFHAGLDAAVAIPSLGVSLPLAEIYANVSLPSEDDEIVSTPQDEPVPEA